jgi:hypothetical protein
MSHRRRRAAVRALIASLALVDVLAAAWLWQAWQERHADEGGDAVQRATLRHGAPTAGTAAPSPKPGQP